MRQKLFTLSFVIVLSLLAFWVLLGSFHSLSVQAAGEIFVNHAVVGGSNDGTSWDNAYTSLQTALANSSSGDEIWVATGVYTPGTAVSDTFQLADNVAIYGGFAATETVREERNWLTNITVLSGDIAGDDTTTPSDVLTSTIRISGTNSYHVVTSSGVTNTALLDGFTITAGQANGSVSNDSGGGMYNVNGHPVLSNIIFSGNNANLHGGGMYNYISSNPTLINVIFSGNSATFGGGMYNLDYSRPTLTNVIFSGNTAPDGSGGGMYNVNYSSSTLTNVTFSGNTAPLGGGMVNSNYSNSSLTNVTFSGNRATLGGGMRNHDNSNPTIQNSIFWNNQDSTGVGTAFASIVNTNFATSIIQYSLVQGCNPNSTWNDSCGTDGGNNQADADPMFVETPDPTTAPTTAGNLRLQATSPAIDVGDNSVVPASVTTDLDGNVRIFNDVVDLGAYEYFSFYTLTLQTSGPGSVMVEPDEANYVAGTMVTLTAVADLGSTFTGWGGDVVVTTTNPITVTMDANKTITATFLLDVPPEYWIFLPVIMAP